MLWWTVIGKYIYLMVLNALMDSNREIYLYDGGLEGDKRIKGYYLKDGQ
jgi:hypothetical protein